MASELPRPIFRDPRVYFELNDEAEQHFADEPAAQLLNSCEGVKHG